jgi:uncharacterized protein YqgC (DUF456 family)
MHYLIVSAGIVLNVLGVLGNALPVIPGAPLNFLALIMLYFAKAGSVSFGALIIFGILTILAVVSDNVLPLLGAKVYGSSKYGIIGSLIGMLVGFVAFSFLGMIVGMMLGTIGGELWAGKKQGVAIKSGMASFVGMIASIIFKVLVSGAMAIYFVVKLF